jgi:asparagine synthase (glutamine-hydrolysing)
MPGIAGLVSPKPSAECRRLVERMLASMRHETFYASGTYAAPELNVFAGWVAHEGSFADCQPVLNEQGDIVLIFAGECFSDTSTRWELTARGHELKEENASWLVHLYEERGDRFFEEMNGTFSGLLIDRRLRKAILFNDRYGVERVYYHEGRDGVFFASEAKALLRVVPALRALDEKGVAQLFQWGCTLGARTLFRDVSLLPGGSVWTFEDRAPSKSRYFTPSNWESQPPLSPDAFEASFEGTFRRVLPRYFESGTAIGLSLTGGLDTRMIMACLPDVPGRLVCYTFAGEDGETHDARIAARVASACGLPHHMVRLGPAFFSDFGSLADRTVYITDGTLGVCGSHEIYLNRQARDLAPVRLTGNVGSEILRGVTTFKPLGLAVDLLAPEYRRHLLEAGVNGLSGSVHPVARAAFEEVPWQLSGLAQAGRSQVSTRTPYLDNELVGLAFRVPDRLRRSRLPTLHLLSRSHPQLRAIPTDRGESLSRSRPGARVQSLVGRLTFKLDYWYQEEAPRWLPFLDASLSRLPARLWPFGFHRYLSYRRWFRRQLADYVRDRLGDALRRRNVLWHEPFLRGLATEPTRDSTSHLREINLVLTVEAIDRLLLHQPAGDS